MQDPNELNKDELYALAQDRDIPGRSSMDRDALVKALYDSATREDLMEVARQRDIAGRSAMDKDELFHAVTGHKSEAAKAAEREARKAAREQQAVGQEWPSEVGGPDVPPPFASPLPQTQPGVPPLQRYETLPQPAQPLQTLVADDRLGDAVDVPEGFHYNGVYDPHANIADATFQVPAEPPFPGYVPPKRPIAVTDIAYYPATNTV